MQSWSDSFIEIVNTISEIIGIIGAVFVAVSVFFMFVTNKEIKKRKSAEIEQMQNAVDKAEEERKPREITSEQCKTFIQLLKDAPKVNVKTSIYLTGGPEPEQFCEQITNLLKISGYTVGTVDVRAQSALKGVRIAVNKAEANSPPLYATELQRAFSAIGIHTEGSFGSSVPAGTVEIIIGLKP